MAEITDLLPMPPYLGPPLPSILKAHWPWVKQPPGKESTLPMAEAPKLVTEPQAPETASQPAPVPAAAPRSVNYEMESPPEILSAGTPTRISPAWIRV